MLVIGNDTLYITAVFAGSFKGIRILFFGTSVIGFEIIRIERLFFFGRFFFFHRSFDRLLFFRSFFKGLRLFDRLFDFF